MQKLGIVTSIIVITSVFIYSMNYISENNTCSGIRVYDCQTQAKKNLVSSEKYVELKATGDLFLKDCKPIIKEEENFYSLDYSKCNLKLNVNKEKSWVEDVSINGKELNREEINSNF